MPSDAAHIHDPFKEDCRWCHRRRWRLRSGALICPRCDLPPDDARDALEELNGAAT